MAEENACPKCGRTLSYSPDSDNPCCEYCGEKISGIQKESSGKNVIRSEGTMRSLSCPKCGKYYGIPESGYTPKYCRNCSGVELKVSIEKA